MKKKILICLAIIIILAVGLLLYFSRLADPLFSDDYSTVVLDEEGRYLRVFLNDQQQWILPPEDKEIPDKLVTAVLEFEDKRFFEHPGIDPLALGRASYQNLSNLSIVSGASTITMQLARLIEPKDRTITNKLLEMIQALRIEANYDKEEILTNYLNHAPYGGNIVGYRTAALKYFAKEAENLTWAEAATLAILPKNPAQINPERNRELLVARRNRLLNSLYQSGEIDQATYQLAKLEEMPSQRRSFPLAAPHLAGRLQRQNQQDVIKTTINRELQEQINQITDDYMAIINEQGINNAAVLISETTTGEVKAYLGSQDFYDQDNLGMIDGVQMRRSSGSTLKPFLYALAIDEGLIVPESKLLDIPISYGAYTPYNYNREFSGVVSAREALIYSLNAPAVNLLEQYGVDEFYQFLLQAGSGGLFREADDYGLPLIIGGSEISLWELNQLYSGLGNYGFFSEINVVPSYQTREEFLPRNQLISSGSSYLTLDMITNLERPGLERFWEQYLSSNKIAWKTGTSYGSRDAWAVGVTPEWTIGVWVGNFAGGGVKDMMGVDSAAPLLFRIFNQLEHSSYYDSFFAKPEYDLERIEVSSQTGYRLEEEVDYLEQVLAPKSASSLRYSPYERKVYLNQAGSQQVCSLCWERDDLKTIYQLSYPPLVLQYLQSRGDYSYVLPPHNPNCPSVGGENPISFVYPQQGSRIFLPRDESGQHQQANFEIVHSHSESRLFWYLNGQYLGETSNTHQWQLDLESGMHKLDVVDGIGNSKSVEFEVIKR